MEKNQSAATPQPTVTESNPIYLGNFNDVPKAVTPLENPR